MNHKIILVQSFTIIVLAICLFLSNQQLHDALGTAQKSLNLVDQLKALDEKDQSNEQIAIDGWKACLNQ